MYISIKDRDQAAQLRPTFSSYFVNPKKKKKATKSKAPKWRVI